MEVLEAITQRRSIRKFVDKPVPDDLLWQIIEAGTWAPSAGNMQAWEFVIVRDPEARQKLVDTTDAGSTSRAGVYTQEWINDAPVVIVVCYDVKRMTARYGQKGRELLTKLDCMLCVQNMLLAATHFGLGTCCVVGFDPQALMGALDIPKELTPILLVPLGYPDEKPQPPFRLPVEDVVRLVLLSAPIKLLETSIEEIQAKAAAWHAAGKKWHFHMLLPGCVYNERPDRQAFVLENTSEGETFVFYSDEPQTAVDHALLLLLHGSDILDESKGQAGPVSDAIQPVLQRAAELNEKKVPWHHHYFLPGCAYSQDKAKWAIAFEDPQTGEVTKVAYEEEPVGEFRQIELLFFDQDMFKV